MSQVQSYLLHFFFFSLLAAPAAMAHGPAITNEFLAFRVPKEKVSSFASPLANMTRDTIHYGIGLFVTHSNALTFLNDEESEREDWLLVKVTEIFESARQELTLIAEEETYLAVMGKLKQFLKTNISVETRHLHHEKLAIPPNRQELLIKWQYRNWPKQIIPKSAVKGLPRIIYRSPRRRDSWPDISIAETLTRANGSQVRETELIIPREDESGHFDFYVYNQTGLLDHQSQFHSAHGEEVKAPIPHTCMTCHYDGENRIFQRRPLSYNGKGH